MGEIVCDCCKSVIDTSESFFCPTCNAVLCHDCAGSNCGMCTQCYDTLKYLS